VTLPAETKAKMWLYHYQDNVIDDWDNMNRKAIEDGFRGFVPTGAMFHRHYDEYEAGTTGKLSYRLITKFRDGELYDKDGNPIVL